MKSDWKGQVFNKHAKNDFFCKCCFLELAVEVLYVVYFFVRKSFQLSNYFVKIIDPWENSTHYGNRTTVQALDNLMWTLFITHDTENYLCQ